MRMYEFINAEGNPAAINLAKVIEVCQEGDGVNVTLGKKMKTVLIPNMTLDYLLTVIEDYSDR
jgi:hypothetical protein